MSRPMSYEEVQKKKVEKIALLHGCVPGAGVEPARVSPSVFETDASTDSAIRASAYFLLSRGDVTRTHDLYVPNVAR